jgi:hypothetical protein
LTIGLPCGHTSLNSQTLHSASKDVISSGDRLSEPGRAFAGERLGEVFPARERVERREERCLWVGDGPRDGRDPQGAFPEGLESERARCALDLGAAAR